MSHKRKLILIDKRFQLRFAFYVSSWIFGLSLVYPLVIQKLLDTLVRISSLDTTGVSFQQATAARETSIAALVLFQIIYLVITLFISIFLSHRIAGPLTKLKNVFKDFSEGKPVGMVRFRKSDHFHDLADDFNRIIESEVRRRKDSQLLLRRSIESIEKAIPYTEAQARIALEKSKADLGELLMHFKEKETAGAK
ncbi:MAG: methyl-accepting chemotaxis protein [Bdellovibrionales bacterium]|nr:methyl-accepting chemotaxis protein [Bdellovibrionales bacterium]